MSIIGIAVGIYGYAFPGNINLMVLDLYTKNRKAFLYFTLMLIALFEIAYCLISLTLLKSIEESGILYKGLVLCSHVLLAIMGLWMIFEKKENPDTPSSNNIRRGIWSIIIHPQQIPFWIIVGSIINNYIPIDNNTPTLLSFALFDGIGTVLIMGLYMFLGARIMHYFKINLNQINKIIGALYIILAVYKFAFT